MKFDLPKDQSSIIKVIGVGGGGGNAVNYMFEQGINGVDFIVCNTDAQSLDKSPVPLKIQLGDTLTEGRGAGSIPEVGRNAAVENLDDVKEFLENGTTMVFVTAGMGGGTGTGAAPIIAKAAKDLGILTVGIVTIPFTFEGKKRRIQAEEGLKEMRDSVDTLLIIRNDKLRELYGNLTLNKAFSHADEVLCTAAKGIAEVITLTGEINVDMNDVKTVMTNSGVAIMGSGSASGDGRAMNAVLQALESPLLNDNDIDGAKFILLNITYGSDEVLMDEITEITDHIQEQAGMSAEVIWGYGHDASLESDLCVTVIATGFSAQDVDTGIPKQKEEVKRFVLGEDEPREILGKVDTPTSVTLETPEEETGNIDVSISEEAEPFLITGTDIEEPVPETPAETISETEPSEADSTAEVEPEVTENMTEEPVEGIEGWTIKTVAEHDEPADRVSDIPQDTFSHEELPADEQVSMFSEEDINIDEGPSEEVETTSLKFSDSIADDLKEEDSKKPAEEDEEVKYYDLDGDGLKPSQDLPSTESINFASAKEETPDPRPSREVLQARNKERESKIREFTMKLKTPSGLSELESEPAYKRKNVQLDDVPHSADSNLSRYTLTDEGGTEGEGKAEIKPNNPFLHDNVD